MLTLTAVRPVRGEKSGLEGQHSLVLALQINRHPSESYTHARTPSVMMYSLCGSSLVAAGGALVDPDATGSDDGDSDPASVVPAGTETGSDRQTMLPTARSW